LGVLKKTEIFKYGHWITNEVYHSSLILMEPSKRRPSKRLISRPDFFKKQYPMSELNSMYTGDLALLAVKHGFIPPEYAYERTTKLDRLFYLRLLEAHLGEPKKEPKVDEKSNTALKSSVGQNESSPFPS
jgi:hypothetical protein